MNNNKEYFYQVFLEVSLKGTEHVLGFINISNIPYHKFEEIFKNQMDKEEVVFGYGTGYRISEELYNNYKDYLTKEISFTFNFDIFDYAVGLSSIEIKNYKKDYYEELP